jgi:hypothetical protein
MAASLMLPKVVGRLSPGHVCAGHELAGGDASAAAVPTLLIINGKNAVRSAANRWAR